MATKMDVEQLKKIIETNWEKIDQINTQTKGEISETIVEIIDLLDSGKIRVAEKKNDEWCRNLLPFICLFCRSISHAVLVDRLN